MTPGLPFFLSVHGLTKQRYGKKVDSGRVYNSEHVILESGKQLCGTNSRRLHQITFTMVLNDFVHFRIGG